MRVYPASFSKYCMGLLALTDDIKKNNFKPKLLNLKKILQ
jgi:hypothetical protein